MGLPGDPEGSPGRDSKGKTCKERELLIPCGLLRVLAVPGFRTVHRFLVSALALTLHGDQLLVETSMTMRLHEAPGDLPANALDVGEQRILRVSVPAHRAA